MTIKSSRIGVFVCIVFVAAILLCGVVYLFVSLASVTIRSTLALEQIHIIYQAKNDALLANDNKKSIAYLEYMLSYYPSGTKQISGSNLDRIVEQVRMEAAGDVIRELRRRTGSDFGNDPGAWIDAFRSTNE